ncbi:hypothetical protein EZS27_026363 [termite gut metagenome]|uniref:Uncharacterized protein n=1 Tax=termite gut metagenome TaxID=433724 RepID=A0A5J4QSV6_9ZZZZ
MGSRKSLKTLEIRPMFHFNSQRIETHVCICFVAYKVYKEFERVIKIRGINLNMDGQGVEYCQNESNYSFQIFIERATS